MTKSEYNNEKLIVSGTGEESIQSNFDTTLASGKRSIAFNRKSEATGSNSVSVGFACNATNAGSLTIGVGSSSKQYGVSLGGLSYANKNSFAVGNHILSSNINKIVGNITKDSNIVIVNSLPNKFKNLIPPFYIYIIINGKYISHKV